MRRFSCGPRGTCVQRVDWNLMSWDATFCFPYNFFFYLKLSDLSRNGRLIHGNWGKLFYWGKSGRVCELTTSPHLASCLWTPVKVSRKHLHWLQRTNLTSYNMTGMGDIRNDADKSQDLKWWKTVGDLTFNHLNAELNPLCHLLALLGAHHILHVSRIRAKNRASYI
jgi:hypothetical protein